MRTLLLAATALLWITGLVAQKPKATFFTSGGEKFFIVMDGKKINSEARSRVENVELDNDWAKVMITFENEDIPPVEKTIQGKDADGNISSVTWEISQNNKGKWVVRPCSWKKIEPGTSQPTETAYQGIREEPTTVNTTTTQGTNTSMEEQRNAGVSTNTGQTVSMSISVDDKNNNTDMSINMSIPANQTQTQTQSQNTYTTIITTTEASTPELSRVQPDPLPGYHGRIGCNNPLTGGSFAQVKESISSKDFEDTRHTVASQVMNANCLLVWQVKEIMMLFDFESTRLDFVREAYSHTYDIDNYYMLNDAFQFESSISELNKFINQ